ncbi:N-acetylglucosamine-1-phosphotransferase subunits alpha/beta [Parasteatoda tepidariorum]|uniref:N-acetylglucosamine-1-phosphotransferase subunits alpha/beta n=1 Tax=Parasteatoda tepidariorum TaxID=114398 RepID=UPI0039BCCA35
MTKTIFCKLLQRKTYDILSKKYTSLFLFLGFITLFVAALHLGETLVEWSKEKYAVVFSPYSDNILGKSYRTMLCQYVPIDVVYTWVNGSDPKFLKELQQAKEEYGFSGYNINCSFSNCVKSQMLLVRPELPFFITESDLEEISPAFQNMEKTFVVSSQSRNKENITVLVFSELSFAEEALALRTIQIDGKNYSLSSGYLTDNWASQHTVLLDNMFMISAISSVLSKENTLDKLPLDIRPSISKVNIYEEKNLAIFISSDKEVVNSALKLSNITLENKVSVISPVYLVVQLPSDHEDISASRFTDNEELRYSLRSLEKHAPWVRHIYIVTNGQIPYWLNLDNPRISIITHHDIFPNGSHLPTFSSPAIECHLHRIPNLSDKFLYLNDDVLFGKNVWPEDFYTHTKGQKVYLSWPVPNCAEGCPSSWIRDGYCDKPCNNSHCQWDGGDCTADNPMLPFQNVHHDVGITSFFHNIKAYSNKAYCNSECADTWLADRYCDKVIYFLCFVICECVGFFNLTDFLASNHTLTEGSYEENPAIRTIAISIKYSIIGIVLHPNHNKTDVVVNLKGESFEKTFHLIVDTQPSKKNVSSIGSTTALQTEESFTFEEFSDRGPKLLTSHAANVSHLGYENVNLSASHLPRELITSWHKLKELLDEDIITYKAFLRKKSELINDYVVSLNSSARNSLKFVTEMAVTKGPLVTKRLQNTTVSLPVKDSKEVPSEKAELSKIILPRMLKGMTTAPSLVDYFKKLQNVSPRENVSRVLRPPPTATQRHLLDTFGDSLRHVNKLYNEVFGYEARKVPSHIAHFVDKNVMSRLTNDFTSRFDSAFDVTSSHKIRSSNDMQFAFSYYYYLMSEMESVEVSDIFRSFDIDKSGSWSDREIRTVLARLYDLPLDFSSVAVFEQMIVNCSLTTEKESKLPVVSETLVKSCQPISHLLLQRFGSRKRNAYEVVGEEEVAFKMIHNNLTQVLGQIDDLRKNPKKFVCLNDNMNHGTQEAELIRAVIEDFYEALFPSRSQFELNPEYRNRFLYVADLEEWRRTRDIIRAVTYITLAILIIFSITSFWKAEMRAPERYPRLRNLQNRHSNPHFV